MLYYKTVFLLNPNSGVLTNQTVGREILSFRNCSCKKISSHVFVHKLSLLLTKPIVSSFINYKMLYKPYFIESLHQPHKTGIVAPS